jgi:ubiquinone/menaquinone biosynthesis C-methylase UbiE
MYQPELRSGNGPANLNQAVRAYWEAEPCGTEAEIVGNLVPYSPEWFAQIEAYRYTAEPFIHAFAQFTRHHGKRVLEVGVGAGADHLQWMRAGAICYGIDLTAAGVLTTREHLALHGFRPALQQVDAEAMPFPNGYFDVVYSWGVIHHAEHPERIIQEIHRVLQPGGLFIGMIYNRHSLAVYKYWVRHALRQGKLGRSLADVVWHHVESIGTKAYTVAELRQLFSSFGSFSATPILTRSDYGRLPAWAWGFLPARLGWFIALQAIR